MKGSAPKLRLSGISKRKSAALAALLPPVAISGAATDRSHSIWNALRPFNLAANWATYRWVAASLAPCDASPIPVIPEFVVSLTRIQSPRVFTWTAKVSWPPIKIFVASLGADAEIAAIPNGSADTPSLDKH